jgi:16S rRNA processing protein RimM
VEKKEFFLAGKIVGAHGVKGSIRIYSYAESLSVYERGSFILVADGTGVEKNYKIKWVKAHGRGALLAFEGIENRNLAENLVGSELFIKKDRLPELEAGDFYWFDIIGLAVFTTDNQFIGNVESIIRTGSNDVYVVRDAQKDRADETLIPALESVVLAIDLTRKRMVVALPEGL